MLSQASEGWKLLPEHYDDGGLSGGTLERPALRRLLADVRKGRIDIIVVYKVDRLTRSLLDFAKLVATFDEAGTSFVSVTQSFNTTTSMGRLTLNMLLSFAQFEREVTAERIPDKIAASKAKGMWMGGTPPLGYRPDGRSLAIVEEHAALIRDIFSRYCALGNVRSVAEELVAAAIRTPSRVNGKGRAFGGCAFTRGQLYAILKNPIYVGDISHKGTVHPGNHPPIIDRDIWEAVQRQLSDHVQGVRTTREANTSLLAGLLVDPDGEPLVPVHASKPVLSKVEGPVPGHGEAGRRRYRYYVSRAHQHGTASPDAPALRLPAREVEQLVRQELTALLADPITLIARCAPDISPAMMGTVIRHCQDLTAAPGSLARPVIRDLLRHIVVHPAGLRFVLDSEGLARLLGIAPSPHGPTEILHEAAVRLTRTGRAVKLVQEDGRAATGSQPGPAMIRLLVTARSWWRELSRGGIDIATLSRREGVTPSWMTRVVRLAFLAPEVVEAILAGRTRAGVDAKALLATGAVPADWARQRALLVAIA